MYLYSQESTKPVLNSSNPGSSLQFKNELIDCVDSEGAKTRESFSFGHHPLFDLGLGDLVLTSLGAIHS